MIQILLVCVKMFPRMSNSDTFVALWKLCLHLYSKSVLTCNPTCTHGPSGSPQWFYFSSESPIINVRCFFIHFACFFCELDGTISRHWFPTVSFPACFMFVGESKQKQTRDHCTHSLCGGEVARQRELLDERCSDGSFFPAGLSSLHVFLSFHPHLSSQLLYLHTNSWSKGSIKQGCQTYYEFCTIWLPCLQTGQKMLWKQSNILRCCISFVLLSEKLKCRSGLVMCLDLFGCIAENNSISLCPLEESSV